MSKRKKYVKIALSWACECGHSFFDHKTTHFVSAYTNDSGTSWPAELEITCPACGGTDERTF